MFPRTAACLAIGLLLLVVSLWATLRLAAKATATTDSQGILSAESTQPNDSEFAFGFHETATKIRKSSQGGGGRSGESPSDGIYDVVYAADYHGRAVRSQGELLIKFEVVPNGWEVRGQTRFSGQPSVIREGFMNNEGELYWIEGGDVAGSSRTLYRGNFDRATNELHDGEFQSSDGTLKGRVVRLAMSKATTVDLDAIEEVALQSKRNDWLSSDIEMVAGLNENLRDMA